MMGVVDTAHPRYGEVWLVSMMEAQGRGSEYREGDSCPAVVVSSDAMGMMGRRLVACIDLPQAAEGLWRVEIPDLKLSGIGKQGVVDAMQLHSVDIGQCVRKIGRVTADCMAEVAAAIAIVVEYED